MSKWYCLRILSNSQHVNRSETLFAQKHFYLNLSTRDEFCWKMSLLVRSEILKYLLTHWLPMTCFCRDSFAQPIQMLYPKKPKAFSPNLLHFSNLNKFLNIFKKIMSPKTWLLKCLKGSVWEHPSAVNVLTSLNHCWNVHEITFIILINQSVMNWVGKSLSYSDLKYQDCLLTHWLPITNILVNTERISRSQCKCNYLRNQMFFLQTLLHFWNLHKFLTILKDKMSLLAKVFGIPLILNKKVIWNSKKPHFRTTFGRQLVNVSQTLLKLERKPFYPSDSSLSNELNGEMSLLIRSKILGLIVKTLTVEGTYSRHYEENFMYSIQMQLCKKSKFFSQNFIAFLKSI